DRSGSVEENVCEMVSDGIKTVQLTVQHQGHHGQRMIKIAVESRECLGDTPPAQACHDVWIFEHVNRVIEIYKLMPQRLAKNRPDCDCEEDTDARDKNPAAQGDGSRSKGNGLFQLRNSGLINESSARTRG